MNLTVIDGGKAESEAHAKEVLSCLGALNPDFVVVVGRVEGNWHIAYSSGPGLVEILGALDLMKQIVLERERSGA